MISSTFPIYFIYIYILRYYKNIFLCIVTITGSRRMSERDLPSRLGRDITAPQQQMHISKSVPALHSK